MIIDKINDVVTAMGLPFRYGNPSQINEYLTHVDYVAEGGYAAFCYLLTDIDYDNGKERASVAVFFSKLMPFDFNGDEALAVADDCKVMAKDFLLRVYNGNSLTYKNARFQHGYNDFAENVGWCAVRADFEMSASDCVPFEKPVRVVFPILAVQEDIGGGIYEAYVISIVDVEFSGSEIAEDVRLKIGETELRRVYDATDLEENTFKIEQFLSADAEEFAFLRELFLQVFGIDTDDYVGKIANMSMIYLNFNFEKPTYKMKASFNVNGEWLTGLGVADGEIS